MHMSMVQLLGLESVIAESAADRNGVGWPLAGCMLQQAMRARLLARCPLAQKSSECGRYGAQGHRHRACGRSLLV